MSKKITVYTKYNCGQCTMTKTVLTNKGLEFEEVNIEEDDEAMKFVKEELQAMSAPVVTVEEEGKEMYHFTGFRPDYMDELV